MQVTCSYPGYIRTEVVFGPLFLGRENRTRNEEGNTESISDHFHTLHKLPLIKWQKDEEENARSYWMTLRTGEDTLIWRRSSRSHYVEEPFWKRRWACLLRDYWMNDEYPTLKTIFTTIFECFIFKLWHVLQVSVVRYNIFSIWRFINE